MQKNVKNEKEPSVYVGIFDDTGRFMGVGSAKTTSNMTNFSFNIEGNFESGKTYMAKAMIWDSNLKALVDEKVINF